MENDARKFGPGLVLGTSGARLLQLSRAYGALAAKGWLLPLQFAKHKNKDLFLYKNHIQLFSPGASWYVTSILSDRIARRRSFGGRNFLDFPFVVAAKTGTSKDYKDSWTIGYTPRFIVGVWVGRFSGGPMHGISGSYGAGRIFQQAMRMVHNQIQPSTAFEAPTNFRQIEICRKTGLRASSLCPAHSEWAETNAPGLERFCPRHARPGELASRRTAGNPDSLAGDLKSQSDEVHPELKISANDAGINSNVIDQNQSSLSDSIRIISPVRGEVYLIDPHTPLHVQAIPLHIKMNTAAELSDAAKQHLNPVIRWRIDQGRWQTITKDLDTTLSLNKGRHLIEMQSGDNQLDSFHFEVR